MSQPDEASTTTPAPFADHYIGRLRTSVSFDGSRSWGSAPVLAPTFAPGTRTIRTGVLATYVDIVGGHVPAGSLGPTVDLRIQVIAPTPTEGMIRLEGRPLRVGRRLVVAETRLHDGDGPDPFAISITTFMNNQLGLVLQEPRADWPPMAATSFDEFIGASVLDERTLALSPTPLLSNGIQGTVQGGVQALLAEMAAQHAFGNGRPMTARDLDIRYLDRLRTGPLIATAEGSPVGDEPLPCRVRLTDGGDGHLVSYVTLVMQRVR
jgi:acyl-coenzyme A thioesterase PaaI-like protein